MSSHEHLEPTIEQTFELARVPSEPETVRVQVAYDLPGTVDAFDVEFHADPEQVTTRGFERTGPSAFAWDGETVRPELSFLITQSLTTSRERGINVIDAGEWTIFEGAATSVRYRYSGTEPTMHTTVEPAGEGVTSDDSRVAFLGPYEEFRERGGDQVFRLIVPDAADLAEPPESVLGSLLWASRQLRIGHRDERLLTIASPGISEEWLVGGRQTGETGFWVNADASLDRPGTSWYHEYVHTRQGFEYGSDLRWLVEGMADYYAGVFGWLHGHVSFDVLHRYLAADGDDAVLAEPSQWTSRQTPYRKGRRVVAALEAAVRERTGGTATFADVARAANEHGGELSYAAFRELVGDVADPSVADWLDEYVTTTAAPSVPRDPQRFELPVADDWPRCRDCAVPLPGGIERCGDCADRASPAGEDGRGRRDPADRRNGAREAEPADVEGDGPAAADGDGVSPAEGPAAEPDPAADPTAGDGPDPTTGDGDQTAGSPGRTGGRRDPADGEETPADEEPAGGTLRPCPVCESAVPGSERYCPTCGHDVGPARDATGDRDADSTADGEDDGPTRADAGDEPADDRPTGRDGTSVECPVCGATDSGRYCDVCGTELDVDCPICGFDHDPGAEYCPGCGHEVGAS